MFLLSWRKVGCGGIGLFACSPYIGEREFRFCHDSRHFNFLLVFIFKVHIQVLYCGVHFSIGRVFRVLTPLLIIACDNFILILGREERRGCGILVVENLRILNLELS